MAIADSMIVIILIIVGYLTLAYTIQYGIYISIIATSLAEGVALALLFAATVREKKKRE